MAKKPSTPPAPVADGTYVSIGAIQHNGESYDAGDVIADLTEADALALLAAGVIEEIAAPASEATH